MRRTVLALLVLMSLTAAALTAAGRPALAQVEKRLALVIGNGAYKEAPLKNPVNDARAMAAKLKQLGFEVIVRENAAQKDMNRAITEFTEKLSNGGNVGLFYYAGHGMQAKGHNYLLPVDAQITSEASVRNESVDVDQVLDGLGTAGNPLNMIILDACRNNPFERRFRGNAGGLAQVDAPKGALIAYATAPGRVAADGEGANGLYTAELLRAIDEPGLRIEDVFKRVRVQVARATNDQQLPWEASSLTGDFYFRAAAKDDSAVEMTFWQSIQNSNQPGDFQAYLQQFPNGRFGTLARNRVAALDSQQQVEQKRSSDAAVQQQRAIDAANAARDAREAEDRRRAEAAEQRAASAEARLQAALDEFDRKAKEIETRFKTAAAVTPVPEPAKPQQAASAPPPPPAPAVASVPPAPAPTPQPAPLPPAPPPARPEVAAAPPPPPRAPDPPPAPAAAPPPAQQLAAVPAPTPADLRPMPTGVDGTWSFKLYGCGTGGAFVLNSKPVTGGKMVGSASTNQSSWDLELKLTGNELEVRGRVTNGLGSPAVWRSSATLDGVKFKGRGGLTFQQMSSCFFEAIRG